MTKWVYHLISGFILIKISNMYDSVFLSKHLIKVNPIPFNNQSFKKYI